MISNFFDFALCYWAYKLFTDIFSRTITTDEDNNEIIAYYALRWRLSVVRRLELSKAHHDKIK